MILTGPTACGKSALALRLAERIGAEIVALDSMTTYRGMDVGTAKPTPEERARIPHHLIDVVDPDEPIDAASVPPLDSWDGLYVGNAANRDGGRVSYGITVRNGIGSGIQSRLDCGTAPMALRISPMGDVSGMATVFGPTCIKVEVAVRGRALAGHLQLRLGTQHLDLAKP